MLYFYLDIFIEKIERDDDFWKTKWKVIRYNFIKTIYFLK